MGFIFVPTAEELKHLFIHIGNKPTTEDFAHEKLHIFGDLRLAIGSN